MPLNSRPEAARLADGRRRSGWSCSVPDVSRFRAIATCCGIPPLVIRTRQQRGRPPCRVPMGYGCGSKWCSRKRRRPVHSRPRLLIRSMAPGLWPARTLTLRGTPAHGERRGGGGGSECLVTHASWSLSSSSLLSSALTRAQLTVGSGVCRRPRLQLLFILRLQKWLGRYTGKTTTTEDMMTMAATGRRGAVEELGTPTGHVF
ncbi:hypothetical protein C2845_PM09G03530 [Panicum miliaceum]|uniref:Uncharacterized protein n=1 Tax=Panicum miliaceum TaxID=4540 RepID=A0A3L6S3A9_PANMI|nr:hypothetical protein C2845_PM09G03530 [Panicum miliaceum]